jgi:hypothetical protein
MDAVDTIAAAIGSIDEKRGTNAAAIESSDKK